MKARRLLESLSYGPEELKIICRAFDDAWASIAGNFGDDPDEIEAARIKLARVVLSFPKDQIRDAGQIASSALQVLALVDAGHASRGVAATGFVACGQCGVLLQIADDGLNTYDLESWASSCTDRGTGTPLLCPHMKATIEGRNHVNGSKSPQHRQ